MPTRWIRFADDHIQSTLLQKVNELGVNHNVDHEGRVWFDDDEWSRVNDPDILTLDEEFGLNWVAAYADIVDQREERTRFLSDRQIRFVVWFSSEGTAIVMDRIACPIDWDYA